MFDEDEKTMQELEIPWDKEFVVEKKEFAKLNTCITQSISVKIHHSAGVKKVTDVLTYEQLA